MAPCQLGTAWLKLPSGALQPIFTSLDNRRHLLKGSSMGNSACRAFPAVSLLSLGNWVVPAGTRTQPDRGSELKFYLYPSVITEQVLHPCELFLISGVVLPGENLLRPSWEMQGPMPAE